MLKPKKLPSGNWNVMVYAGTENGKRKYKSITAATRNEVLFLAAEWKLKRPGKGQMTLREAYTQYCDTRRNVLSASTMREYARITKRSDYPIMDMSIDSITTHDVQNAVNSMARDHSAKTVRNHHGLFSAVMSAYRPDAKFSVSLPKNKTQEVYIPEPETIKRLYTLLQGNWLFVPFILASQCGLRASEVAGLQYKHVTPGKLLIRQARVAGEFGETLKDTKTDSGKRDVRCSPEVIKLLGTGEPDQYVVPHSAFQISDGWGDFMRSHPEEKYFTFHKLRHYFASNALLLGIPKKYVAKMMGHKNEHMLDQIYEHVFQSAQDAFGDQLAAVGNTFFSEMQDKIQDGISRTTVK